MRGDPFYLLKGRMIHDLNELSRALKDMDEEEYSHHVNKERNDFANWAENSLGKKSIAERIRKARNRKELEEALKEPKKKQGKKQLSGKQLRLETEKPVSKEKKPEAKEEQAKKTPGQTVRVREISTEAPHHFIVKEFLLGALFGLLIGLILMSALIRTGIITY